MGWLLLALPPKNRTCEFPRIRLKWRRPFPSRLVSASLYFNHDCSSLLAALFCHPRSKSAPTKIS
ncbi:unnamed protein product [Withania somnifera]